MQRPFLTAEWRHLAMLNWGVDPGLLLPLVPAGTELDRHAGRCLVSVVGLRFLDTRVRGHRIPFHSDFDEVNLRFYVRRQVEDEVRRAVVFVRELVPLPAVAFTARLVYGERYSALPMRSRLGPDDVEYRWRLRGRWQRLRADAAGPAALPGEGSEEEFVTEHYWGYATGRRGTLEYRVEHAGWPVRRARRAELDCDSERLYGPGFAAALDGPPASAFLAAGSPVSVYPGERLNADPVSRGGGRSGQDRPGSPRL
jgi:uncharacterized protein